MTPVCDISYTHIQGIDCWVYDIHTPRGKLSFCRAHLVLLGICVHLALCVHLTSSYLLPQLHPLRICILSFWKRSAKWKQGIGLEIKRSGVQSQCWSYIEVLGKLCVPHCLGPPSFDGYLVHKSEVGSILAGCIGTHLARGKGMKTMCSCGCLDSK